MTSTDIAVTRLRDQGSPIPWADMYSERYRPWSRYPSSTFDITIVHGERVTVAEMEQRIVLSSDEHLQEVLFIGQYAGPPFSTTFRLVFGSMNRTLSHDEVGAFRMRVIGGLADGGFHLKGN